MRTRTQSVSVEQAVKGGMLTPEQREELVGMLRLHRHRRQRVVLAALVDQPTTRATRKACR